MNQETVELVKQYITETLKDVNGISNSAYTLLGYMMKTDRNLASHLHDVYDQCIETGSRHFIRTDDFID
jgi:hypothetical protein